MSSDLEAQVSARVRPEDIRRGWLVAFAIVLIAMGGFVVLNLARNGTAYRWHVADHDAPHARANCPA